MIICLGPVCCPIWPLLFLALKPVWMLLPDAWKQSIEAFWTEKVQPKLNPILDKIPPKVRKFLFFGTSAAKCKTGETTAAKSCCSGGSCEMSASAKHKKDDDYSSDGNTPSTSGGASSGANPDADPTGAVAAALAAAQAGSLLHFDTDAEFKAVMSVVTRPPHNLLVFVDYTAPWCKPCQKIKPKYQELAKGVGLGRAVFCVVDIDELDDLAMDQGVSAIPAIHCWKRGAVVGRLGMVNEEKLENFVAKWAGAGSGE